MNIAIFRCLLLFRKMYILYKHIILWVLRGWHLMVICTHGFTVYWIYIYKSMALLKIPVLDIKIATICQNFCIPRCDEKVINREWSENWIMEKLKTKNVTYHMSHATPPRLLEPTFDIWISNLHVDLGVYISIWSETELLETFLSFIF